MVMGRLLLGSPPRNDAGNVPVAVPTNVPCSELLLQGSFPADPPRGLCFSNTTASSTACVSICTFFLLLIATLLATISSEQHMLFFVGGSHRLIGQAMRSAGPSSSARLFARLHSTGRPYASVSRQARDDWCHQ